MSDEENKASSSEMEPSAKKARLNCQRLVPSDVATIGAFALSNSLPEGEFPELEMLEKPFLNQTRSTLHRPEQQQKDDSNKNSDKNANLNEVNYAKSETGVDCNCNPNEKGKGKVTSTDVGGSGDFVVKPSFANCDDENDLGAFFRECQSAPPLASFASQPTFGEQVSDITSQLEKFEMIMPDYDNFVDSICKDSEK